MAYILSVDDQGYTNYNGFSRLSSIYLPSTSPDSNYSEAYNITLEDKPLCFFSTSTSGNFLLYSDTTPVQTLPITSSNTLYCVTVPPSGLSTYLVLDGVTAVDLYVLPDSLRDSLFGLTVSCDLTANVCLDNTTYSDLLSGASDYYLYTGTLEHSLYNLVNKNKSSQLSGIALASGYDENVAHNANVMLGGYLTVFTFLAVVTFSIYLLNRFISSYNR